MKEFPTSEIAKFLAVVHRLRQECPWDRKQTHESLAPYLLEEAHEALEAIEVDRPALADELGDLLLQIALHSEIASETGDFDFEKVAAGISKKMIDRHPHVYGDTQVKDAEEVKSNWMALKKKEKPDRSLLDGIPKTLPALQRSFKFGHRAASVGFDWPDVAGVLAKVKEELGELVQEIEKPEALQEAVEMELGDVLFTVANLGRHLGVDPEAALRKSNAKFAERIKKMESKALALGKALSELTDEELEAEWERAKG